MNTRHFLFLLFLLGLVVSSCQKEFIQETPTTEGRILPKVTMIDLAAAMLWYENNQIEQLSTRSGARHPLFETSFPDWETCFAGESEACKTVETYLNILNQRLILTPEVAQVYEETGDLRYLRVLTRLVVLTEKENNEIKGFYMTIVPSKNYLEKTNFKPFTNNSYMVRDKDMDGYVMYHELNGNFINGWIYEHGKVTTAIYGEASDSSIQTRAGTMVCTPHYEQTCTDYYYSVNEGELIYNGTSCDAPVYAGSDCYATGGSGVGGGGGGNVSIGDKPIKYTKREGDKFAKANLSQTMTPQIGNSCVISLMEYIDNYVFENNIKQSEYALFYLKTYGHDVYWEGVRIEFIIDFINQFFNTINFTSYQNAINNGSVVLTDVESNMLGAGHSICIVGYRKDRTCIYMDSEDGKLYSVNEKYFKKDFNIVITGIKK